MLQVVAVQNIGVGDVLAEGLVISVDKSDPNLTIFHTPMGDVRAPARASTVRITRLGKTAVATYIRAMGRQQT